ncbi:MAG: DNA-processing protein DprA [Pseudomonadota bacterium]
MTDALRTWLRLRHTPKFGTAAARKLLDHFDSIDDINNAGRDRLLKSGLGKGICDALLADADEAAIERDLEWSEGVDQHILPFADARYPARLRSLSDAPMLLYVRGDIDVLHTAQLAVVGSRNPTPEGQSSARLFSQHLASRGLTITSGLALGIDAASHIGALEGKGLTIAVAGTGLDRIYPAQHRELAERILVDGAIVSEFPIGTTARAEFFPRRNRIISGLSIGTLVVEAALRSGSLTTARHASEQGREVFAIPGSIQNTLARGCHRLIRDGAKLVETADDILEELAPLLGENALTSPTETESDAAFSDQPGDTKSVDPAYQALINSLAGGAQTVDALVQSSGVAAAEVASMLLMLELNGTVTRLDGGRYALVGR